jgi:copper homeostasis protein
MALKVSPLSRLVKLFRGSLGALVTSLELGATLSACLEARRMAKLLIEMLAGSADDCVAAERLGADRVELNSGLGLGGLTPSPGAVASAKAHSRLSVMAMLRPRPAGFAYSALDLEAMAYDGSALVRAGADGLVFGVLREDGSVDAAACERLMSAVPDCREWVFHRAFDLAPDPFAALEELVALGLRRILTKGQANSFEEGERLLLELRERAAGRIEILVPGVRPHNLRHIVDDDGFDQIHLGRFGKRVDPSNSSRPEVYFGSDSKGHEGEYDALDEAYAAEMVSLARASRAARAL